MGVLPALTVRHRLGPLSLSLLVGLAAALLAWVFVHFGSEMAEGDTRAVDLAILRAMQAVRDGHPWVAAVIRDLSGLSSTAVLTLGALLASTRGRALERASILAVAAFMTLLVGLSRVELGVHWATDVMTGWAYGFGWGLVWLLLARAAVGRGTAEADPVGIARP